MRLGTESRSPYTDHMDIPHQHRVPLATALRATADRLANGARYEWGHVGRCNCGHLVQSLTGHTDREILRAFRHDLDEWTELANDYCPVTGADGTQMFAALYELGLTARDVHHLEYLSDGQVLAALPASVRQRGLARNQRADVVLYLRTMADVLAPLGGCVTEEPERVDLATTEAADPVLVLA